jgi:predicted short-subunit dehydrogenase-like oxidoreductase (DUF2520 family)
MKPKQKIRKISIIGAGNLGTNMALALFGKGFRICEVYDIDQAVGKRLADKVGAVNISSLRDLSPKSDLYILSICDKNLGSFSKKINLEDKLVVHTSGSVRIEILQSSSRNIGVIYPPQTFSKDHPVSFTGVPVCIEANTIENVRLLKDLIAQLSKEVYLVTFEQRKMIHLAAVFASNFTSFFYSIAEELLSAEGIDAGILRPIIRKTADNSKYQDIFRLQTGPAVREDYPIMKTHLDLLKKQPEYRDIYESISNMIIRKKHERKKL